MDSLAKTSWTHWSGPGGGEGGAGGRKKWGLARKDLTLGGEKCLIVSQKVKTVKEASNEREEQRPQGGAVLTGMAQYALDPKRRVTIPSGWRDAMGRPAYVFVMADPHEPCLRLLSEERMAELRAKLLARKFADPLVAQKLRIIGQNTEQLPLDVQGRIRISDRLLKFAGVSGKIAFVGAITYGEIWAAERCAMQEQVDQTALNEALSALDF